MASPTHLPAWQALVQHHETLANQSISTLFASDSSRVGRFSLEAAGLYLDYSKNLLDQQGLDLLIELAHQADLDTAISAMFQGDIINNTEQRAVLHVALRSPERKTSAEQLVHETLDRMEIFVHAVTHWQWRGFQGDPITDVVNIGIGGSDLGPAMVYSALGDVHLDGIRCHFVSNVDPAHLDQVLAELDPATTLFVVASKTFTTLETRLNAQAARQWFLDSGASVSDLPSHFVAVTTNLEEAGRFGIPESNIFPMWDWVGGRYSLWSAIGLPIALGTGMENFRTLLAGAHAMDEHFRSGNWRENLPVMLALLECWTLNFQNAGSRAILPYSQHLALFPAFLQQLEMESLGKSVTRDGELLDLASCGIIWGSAGTNGQHSFHQLLHQGTHLIPADFIAVAKTHHAEQERHQQLLANCFAQSQAMINGKTLADAKRELLARGLDEQEAARIAPHKAIPGNRPSNTIILDDLSPATLGALIAAYEHKVFVRSVILGINAFDQYGVELGKILSKDIYQALIDPNETSSFDSSTNSLINRCK